MENRPQPRNASQPFRWEGVLGTLPQAATVHTHLWRSPRFCNDLISAQRCLITVLIGNYGVLIGNYGVLIGNYGALIGNYGALIGNVGALIGNVGALIGNVGALIGNYGVLIGNLTDFRALASAL